MESLSVAIPANKTSVLQLKGVILDRQLKFLVNPSDPCAYTDQDHSMMNRCVLMTKSEPFHLDLLVLALFLEVLVLRRRGSSQKEFCSCLIRDLCGN